MTNSIEYARRLLENLKAAFSKNLNAATLEIYLSKLARYNLPEESWNRATSRMVSELESFPTIAIIKRYLMGAIVRHGMDMGERYWVTFKLQGREYAMPCHDPDNPPCPPPEAYDLHLVIPEDKQDKHQRVSMEEARECFRRGWLESGADPSKCDQYFRIATMAVASREVEEDEIPWDA